MGSVPTSLNYRVLKGSVTAANDNHTYHTITDSRGTRTSVWKTTYAGLSYPGFTANVNDLGNYQGRGCLGWESQTGSGSPGNPFRMPIPLFPALGGAPPILQYFNRSSTSPLFVNGLVQDLVDVTNNVPARNNDSRLPMAYMYPRNYFVNNIMCDDSSFLYIETKGQGVYYYYITQIEIWIGD